MYTIEYYKTKQEKPRSKEGQYLNNDLIEKYWNIKSLTIDIEDIEHIIQDQNLRRLFSLYARVMRVTFDENINSVTILNNNDVNLSYIQEIINCKWMVNATEEIKSLDLANAKTLLVELNNKYAKADEQKKRIIIKNKIELIEYYLKTITNKYNKNQKSDKSSIKLGKCLIKEKKEL